MLETRNIFIDTQTFVANNFFVNENLTRLADFGEKGIVNLFLTEITINEIQSNIKEELQNAQEEINRFKKSIHRKGRILKNIDEFQQYLRVPELKLEIDYQKIKIALDKFIKKGKVKIIPYNLADLNGILSKYFNQEKPFGVGKKKHEFPDAIVLSAIEEWCRKERCKIYVISDDQDFKEYSSDEIISIPTLRKILNKIHTQYDSDKLARLTWLQEIYDKSESTIIDKIKERFKDEIEDVMYYDIELHKIRVINVKLFEPSIVQDNEGIGETIFQLDADISFEAEVEYSDYSHSFYDKEDNRWLMPEKGIASVNIETTQTVEISIEASYADKLTKGIENYSISCTYCSVPDSEEITDNLEGYILQI